VLWPNYTFTISVALSKFVITHADGSCWGRVEFLLKTLPQQLFTVVCLSVFFLHNTSKTDTARITKLDVQMFHDDSWKLISFWVKGSRL